ncbi:MAG: sialidase family protein [Anaerolineae bacterium]
MKRRTHLQRIHLTAGILAVLCAVALLLVTQVNAWQSQDSLWSGNVAISDPQAIPQNPDVAVDDAGRAYAVWYDAQAGAGRGIYVASRPAGGAWTPPIEVPGSDAGNASWPTIAAAAPGAVCVAWARGLPETRADILFAWSMDGGITWEGPVQINVDSQDIAGQPDLTVDAHANVHVVWSDLASFGDRHSRDIKWSMRFAGLTTWTGPAVVHPDVEVITEQARPAITADDAGNVYVIWEDARHGPGDPQAIYAARLPAGTMMWEPGRRVDHRPGATNARPDIAAAPDGTVHAVWDAGTAGEVYSAMLRPGAETWGSPTRINGVWQVLSGRPSVLSGSAPRIAVDRRGIAYALWQDSRNGETDIYAAVRWPGGMHWGRNRRVNDDEGPAAQEAPAIAGGEAGRAVAVWIDQRQNSSGTITAAELQLTIHTVRLSFLVR